MNYIPWNVYIPNTNIVIGYGSFVGNEEEKNAYEKVIKAEYGEEGEFVWKTPRVVVDSIDDVNGVLYVVNDNLIKGLHRETLKRIKGEKLY